MKERVRNTALYFSILAILLLLPYGSKAFTDGETSVLYTTETLFVLGNEISLPDGTFMSGNGTPEDPYYIDSVWINNSKGPGVVINGSSKHIILSGLIVTNSIWARADGIFISNSTNVTIVDTIVQGCYIGIHLDNSSNVQVVGSDLSGNRYGMLMRRSPGIAVTDCTASGNLIDGFYVERSEQCIISFCQLISNSARISNDAAIRIIRSSHSIIQGCEIRMNYGTGVFLQGPMRLCTVLDCDINYNNEGMIMDGVTDSRV